ncbi:sulfite exporter TauE/SafE family protein [Orrella sp. 11846]|uniref:sulfite exporter TauE/SafE family protein n=1 Tax=Orrella sp. 11846 TaxID=3409913 RepID=UPI003B5A6863
MLSYWNELFPTTGMFAVLLLTTIVGATMRAFSGFGAGLLLAPVLSLYLVPADVVIVVIGLNFMATFQVLPGVRKDIDWPLVWRMVPAALIGIPLGGWVLSGLDQHLMRKLVAAVVVVLSLILLAGWHYRGRRGRIQDSIAGLTSGVLTSIGGIGGPPFVLYMMSAKDVSPVAIRTFFIIFFAIMQVVTLAMFLVQGAMRPIQFAYIGTFLPFYVMATWLGSYLFVRALSGKADLVRRISLWFLLLVGIGTFVV